MTCQPAHLADELAGAERGELALAGAHPRLPIDDQHQAIERLAARDQAIPATVRAQLTDGDQAPELARPERAEGQLVQALLVGVERDRPTLDEQEVDLHGV